MTSAAFPLPLSGIRVLETGSSLAVAVCGRLLRDLGAMVTKVEPLPGDPARNMPPYALVSNKQIGSLFVTWNGGKRSVTVGQSHRGCEVLRRLAGAADVVVVDDSAGTSSPGLGAEELGARWPAIVVTSITPYGLTGGNSGRPGHEVDLFHSGGEGSLLPGGIGFELFPDRAPIRSGRHVVAFDSGLAAAIATMACLFSRLETGRGDLVDISQQEVEISLNRINLDSQWNAGMFLSRAHRGFDYGGTFPCRDGYVTVRPNENAHWQGLARGIGHPELATDPRFATRDARHENADALNRVLVEYFSSHTMREIYDSIGAEGCPVGYYASPEDVVESGQFRARQWFRPVQVDDQVLELPAAPFRMSATPPLDPARPPLLGEHSDQVLGEIGYSASEQAELRELAVI
jgi:crotonobetainyl-CoA:carnitine CoA-transferase CaiB-like acyl-CoA transferase